MYHSSLFRRPFAALVCLLTIGISACTPAAPTSPTQSPTQSASVATTEAATAGRVLTIGEVSNNPTETIENFQLIADYLAARLTQHGYTSAVVKPAPNFETMVEWLKNGTIDMTFDSVYPAMVLIDRAGVKPILRRWKGGTEQYNTVIFTRADTSITTLAGLKGKMIAFEESFSTSGYMLPKAFLTEADFKVVEEKSTDETVGAEEIGYVFTNGDDPAANVIQWTVSGKTAAGAVNSSDFSDIPDETRKLLVILGETEPLPRHLVLVRGDLDPAVTASLKQAMLEMTTPEAADALEKFDETAKFDDFPQGLDQAVTRMRELYTLAEAGSN